MKNRKIPIYLTAGLSLISGITPVQADDPIQAIEAPTGTIYIAGDSYNYGEKPQIKIALNVPQIAAEVIDIGGGALNPNDTTLHIKQDSTLRVTVLTINMGSSVSDREIEASALINAPANERNPRAANYWGDKHIFFKGSLFNLTPTYDSASPKTLDDGSVLAKDSGKYWALKPEYTYNFLPNNLETFQGKTPGIQAQYVEAKTYDGKYSLDVPVKKGDDVDFHIFMNSAHARGTIYADTRLRSNLENRDWGLKDGSKVETDDKQRQIVSLFDGMPVPLNSGVGSQDDILDLLAGYTKQREDGVIVADLEPTQVINLVDQNYKYNNDGTPSYVYDLQDFVFLVEVLGRKEFVLVDAFDYYLVKIDIPAPTVNLDPDGNPYVDQQGNYIEPTFDSEGNPLVDNEGNYVDEEGNLAPIVNVEGEDSITFDEAIKLDPENFDPNATYQFETPNGIYGSVYKLVYIAKRDVNVSFGGSGTENPEIKLVKQGEEVTIDEIIAESLRIPYEFAITGLKDPSNPYALDPKNVGPLRMMADDTYSFERNVTNFMAPSNNLKTPRGAYAKLFKHRKFTYNEGETGLLYNGTTPQNYFDVASISGMEESGEQTLVNSGALQTSPITSTGGSFLGLNNLPIQSTRANVSGSGISPEIAAEKNGEEHFTCFNYLARWGKDAATGEPIIIGYDLYLPNKYRTILKVYTPPTATLEFTNSLEAIPTRRSYPAYKSVVKNIYPKATVYVRNRSTSEGADPDFFVKTREVRVPNGNDIKLEDELYNGDGPDMGNYFNDGPMVMEVVHEIDYDGDGEVDDTRVLATKPWILNRTITIKGGINSSK